MTHTCAWPDCSLEGSFPAPKDPRDLRLRQYFCQTHIREFNKRWNGLEGFHPDDIFKMQNVGPSWDKPTWTVGVSPTSEAAKSAPFANADDLFDFFQQRIKQKASPSAAAPLVLPPDVKEALVIFNIEQPLPAAPLKKHYLALVKQHHPDVNKSATAEEHLKRINVAYKILADYADRA
ncbi:MAG: DnaJ domain-containing protein [Pseudomonadaceae bacterium]|nr:DnaJ domain-containing protein [Pseudomonadaceae bacterium]